MEYVTQIEKTVDILIFLLSKVPLDFDGEGSYLTSSLQVFISELHHQQKYQANISADDELINNSKLDEKTIISADYGSNNTSIESPNVSAILDENTIEEYLPMVIPSEESPDCTNDEITSTNLEHTSDMIFIQEEGELNQTKTVKRKYKRKVKQECEKEEVDQKDIIQLVNQNSSGGGEGLKSIKSVKSFKFHCCLCNCNFETEQEFRNHDLEHHCVNGTLKCDDCNFTAATKKSLIEHYADQHKESKIFKMKFANQNATGHGYKKLKYCRHCDQIFLKAEFLRYHLYQLHNLAVPINKCLMCLREFESERKARNHMDANHIGLKIKCAQFHCDKNFDTDDEYQNHFTEKHQKADKYTCHICGEVYRSDKRACFNRHVESHGLEGKQKPEFECIQCPKVFFFETDLKSHMSQFNHGGKFFTCSICGYNLRSKTRLECHLAERHSSERPFGCELCGKRFSNIRYFQKHKRQTHSTTRNFECSVCSKKFKERKHLNVHAKIHRQEYTAQCDYCDAKFVQSQNMKPHMKKHHPEMITIEKTEK